MNLSDAYSIIDLAREAGFKTTWISNQSRYGVWDTPIGAIGSACDDQYWVNQYIGTDVITKDYDTALVPYLKKIDTTNRRQLIVIHLMGSHVSYWDRYPSEFYHWPRDVSKERTADQVMIDEYDNSVLFNDYVIESIMNEATNTLHADGVFYMSDHGEQVTARPGHNADQFDYTMVHIPFWVYLSDRYVQQNPNLFKTMLSRRNMPFSNDMLYDTLMGFMGLKAAHYDPTADIFSSQYNKDLSNLVTMYGNIWIRDDKEQLGDTRAEDDRRWNADLARRAEEAGHMNFNWSHFEPIKIAAPQSPEVPNDGPGKAG